MKNKGNDSTPYGGFLNAIQQPLEEPSLVDRGIETDEERYMKMSPAEREEHDKNMAAQLHAKGVCYLCGDIPVDINSPGRFSSSFEISERVKDKK